MAKPKIPNQRNRYAKLRGRLNKYALAVQDIYDTLNKEAARIAASTDFVGNGVFRFSDYPMTADAVNRLQGRFVREMQGLIYAGTAAEWKESNLVQDLLASKVLKTYGAQVSGQKTKVYYQSNSDALKAFQQRTEKGMNLSEKLWNQSGNYKQELEYAISSAIEKGTSAVTLSKRLSKYLNDFPSLKADYKEKFGQAVTCHDCEYRSIRLARTEINMAYRTAEQTRWKQMDFVVGYEVKTSYSHEEKDICDSAQGKYPKDFVFVGWHPNCMCYVIPILKTEDEFWADDPNVPSVNEVTDVPDGFKTWIADNQERIAQAEMRGTLPYFLADNQKYVDVALTADESLVAKEGIVNIVDYTDELMVYDQKSYEKVISLLCDDCSSAWQNATIEERESFVRYSGQSKKINQDAINDIANEDVKNMDKVMSKVSTSQDLVLRSGQFGSEAIEGIFGEFGGRRPLLTKIIDGDIEALNERYAGKVGVNKAYLSTSYTANGGLVGDFEFRILLPKGNSCMFMEPLSRQGMRAGVDWNGKDYIANFHDFTENEVLLPRGLKYRFVKADIGNFRDKKIVRIFVEIV